jgi:tetratricopeptide (TPR) repeat protein
VVVEGARKRGIVFGRSNDRLAGEANALLKKGIEVGLDRRTEEALRYFDEIIRRFGDERASVVSLPVANAFYNKAMALYTLKRFPEAIQAWDGAVVAFDRTTAGLADSIDRHQGPMLLQMTLEALRYKAWMLGDLRREDEAQTVWSEVARRCESYRSPPLCEQWTRAICERAEYQAFRGSMAEAFACYARTLERARERKAGAAREITDLVTENRSLEWPCDEGVAVGTLSMRAQELSAAGRGEEAALLWNEILRLARSGRAPELFGFMALLGEADAWMKRLRYRDALSAYQLALSWYGDRDDEIVGDQLPQLKQQIASLARDAEEPLHAARHVLGARLPEPEPGSPIPQFVRGKLEEKSGTLELFYMAHDAAKHLKGETGFACLQMVALSVAQSSKGQVRALSVYCPARLPASPSPDTNYTLFMEAAAVFGLPSREALAETHAGKFAAARSSVLQTRWVRQGTSVLAHFASPQGEG